MEIMTNFPKKIRAFFELVPPLKTNHFEDIFPIENGDFPMSC